MPRWRRFTPKHHKKMTVSHDDIFEAAYHRAIATNAREFALLDKAVSGFKKSMNQTDATSWLTLLLLQAPRAAHAQSMMDEHPHGYHHREKRLFELIDFNDTFVAFILQLRVDQLVDAVERTKQVMDRFCTSVLSKSFTDEQFEAISHGLSREIAVYRAAKHVGLNAVMGSRVADSLGVDMQIQDPETGQYVNIDCKTGSSYFFRTKDLARDGKISPEEHEAAEQNGWCEIEFRAKNSKRKVRTILLRIDQKELGEIRDFGFIDDRVMRVRLYEVIRACGLEDGKYGQMSG